MPLIELARVDFREPGISPPGRRKADGSVEYPSTERFLVNVPSTNRLRDRGHYKMTLDVEARMVYVENVAEGTVSDIPLECVRQVERAAAPKKAVAK